MSEEPARDALFEALWVDEPPSSVEQGWALIDAYAHELAEKQRADAFLIEGEDDCCRKYGLALARSIDPEVSCGGYCSCACHAVDPSPCDDCSGG